MASPQPPYDGGPEGGAYGQQQQAPAPANKKKNRYAGQAYEFGAGANSQQPGGPPAPGGAYPGQPAPAQPAYGYQSQPVGGQAGYGMPQQPAYGDPAAQNAAPQQGGFQQPQYGAPTGYEAPAPGYPTPVAPGMQQPQGVVGMTQQFGQMGMGGQQPAQPPQQQGQGVPMRLNPLQPVDISLQGQPFHVSDLDQAPPPIILPPNVSMLESPWLIHKQIDLLMLPTVFGHTFALLQLLAQICAINAQCHARYELPPQEEQASIRFDHPAICCTTRCGR